MGPDKELLTVFWQNPRPNQLCTELGDGVILIKEANTRELIGTELLAYKPGDARFDSVSLEIGASQTAA